MHLSCNKCRSQRIPELDLTSQDSRLAVTVPRQKAALAAIHPQYFPDHDPGTLKTASRFLCLVFARENADGGSSS